MFSVSRSVSAVIQKYINNVVKHCRCRIMMKNFVCMIVNLTLLTQSWMQQKVTEAWGMVWVNITESITLAPAQSHFQPGYTWSSRIRSLCGIGKDGLMYTITHTHTHTLADPQQLNTAPFVSLDMEWQGIRLIKQMCPAANNMHNQGVFKFT